MGRVLAFFHSQRERRWWRWRKAIAVSLVLLPVVLGRNRLAAEYHYVWIVAHTSSSSMATHMLGLDAIQHDGAIPPLLRLSRSRSPQLRSFAAQTLGKHRGGRVVDALIRLARGDPDKDTQTVAIGSLGKIADPRALPVLQELTRQNGHATYALAHFGEAGKRALLENVATAPLDGSRAGALGELCGPYEPSVFLADPAVRAEVRLRLSDASWEVRAAAAHCVSKMAGAPKSEWLRALLQDPESMVQLTAASELGKLGDRSGFETASRVLADVALDQEVRARAALTLRDTGDPRARGFLCEVARSGAPFRVVDMCRTALANLFDKGTAYDDSMCTDPGKQQPPNEPKH